MESKSNKTLWIVNQYAGSKYHGMVFRSYYIAKELVNSGWNVVVFSGSFSHLFIKPPCVSSRFTFEEIDGITFCWVKLRKYTESRSVNRVLSMIEFMLKLFMLNSNLLPKPSAILVSSPSPFSLLNGFRFARQFKSKLIYEVRDLWPLTLVELGSISRFNPFVVVLQLLEKLAYRVSDHVVSVLPGTKPYMISHGMRPDKFLYVPNGIDLDEMSRSDELEEKVEKLIPVNKFIVGHLGSVSISHSLESLISAANLMISKSDVHFLIVGNGPDKDKLKQAVIGNNVTFIDAINKSQVQSMLANFDICYLGCPDESIYKYGISANKVFDYMYSSKPIIHSGNVGFDPIVEASCGVSVAPEDPEAIVAGIEHLRSIGSHGRMALGRNGRVFVEKHHSYKELTKQLNSVLMKL